MSDIFGVKHDKYFPEQQSSSFVPDCLSE